jgi:two-component system, chemotaxis family, CheB/CheR fusion protein
MEQGLCERRGILDEEQLIPPDPIEGDFNERQPDETSSEEPALPQDQLLDDLEQERGQLKALTESLEQQVAERTRQLRALGSALSLAEQQERSRISRILHDDLQQILYGLLIRLNLLKADTQGSAALTQIEEITAKVNQAIDITRTLVVELNPPVLQGGGIVKALEWPIVRLEEIYHLEVQLSAPEEYYISRDEQTFLLQIVRELFFNIVKHAKATLVKVEVGRQDEAIIIRIEDNGVGFDPEEVRSRQQKRGGFGLFNIEERLALIGGRLEIDTTPGQGTRMAVFAPVEWKS